MNAPTDRGQRVGGLALKFNLLIASLIALTVLIMVATSAFYYRSKTSDELTYHGQSILNVLAELSESQMLNLDRVGLEHAIDSLANDSKITHAAFYDVDGNLLVHKSSDGHQRSDHASEHDNHADSGHENTHDSGADMHAVFFNRVRDAGTFVVGDARRFGDNELIREMGQPVFDHRGFEDHWDGEHANHGTHGDHDEHEELAEHDELAENGGHDEHAKHDEHTELAENSEYDEHSKHTEHQANGTTKTADDHGADVIGYIIIGLNTHFLASHTWGFLASILPAVFLLLLAAIGVSRLFVRKITSPLKRLHVAAHSIASGELNTIPEIKSRDEIAALGTMFNEMVEQLSRTRAEVENQQRVLEDTVSSRTKELSKALKTSQLLAEKAEKASKSKSEFLATMSH